MDRIILRKNNNYISFMIIGIIISFFVLINYKLSIAFVLLCYLMLFIVYCTDSWMKLMIILIVSIPYNYNVFQQFNLNITIKGFTLSIIDFLYYITIAVICLKKLILKNKLIKRSNDIIFNIFIILLLFYAIFGFMNKNIFFYTELKPFIYFLFYFILKDTVNIDMNQLIKLLTKANIIHILFMVVMVLYQGTIGGKERLGFNNLSVMFLMTLIYYYKIYITKIKKEKIFYIIMIFGNMFCFLISQNRTIFLLVVLYFISINIYFLFNVKSNYLRSRLSIIILTILAIIILLFSYKSILELPIFQRLTESDNILDVSTIQFRLTAYEYLLDKIKMNPFGYGIGKEIPLFNIFNTSEQTITIDNAFITIAYKMGIIGALVLIIMILNMQHDFIYLSKKGYPMYNLFTVFFPSYVFLTAIINTQIVYSPPNLVFILLLRNVTKNYLSKFKSKVSL